jgi:hypothetical protein
MLNLAPAHWLVLCSALISIAGAIAYIRDTLLGKAKPNLVSWSMWALAPLIGTAAAVASDADIWATVRIFLAGFLPLLVVVASFVNRNSIWKLTVFDLLCGALSLLALIVWGVVDSPKMAILLAASGDGFAAIPTMVKAWRYPETETGISYLASLLSVMLVIPSIPAWNIENSAFQLYLLVVNVILVLAVYRRKFVPWGNNNMV